MARPTKQGLDYFALDVTMNDEVEIIEAEHGLVGYAILIKLFQKIYSEGYYHNWNDRDIILFSNRVSVDRNLLTSIVDDCIKWGIFDKQLFDKYNILTSKRIQNHYFIATYKRVDVEVIKEYLLIDVSDRTNLLMIGVSVDSNEGTSIVSDSKSTQSKVEESILKEIKIDNTKKEKPPTKTKYGEFEKVKLTEEEHKKLLDKLGQVKTDDLVERLDNYKASTGKTYKSDYATILNWHRREAKDESGTNKSNGNSKEEGKSLAERAGVISL